jgi:16S rRNA (adenine1518-N6/adenine1519-N6)-dimethyltransferase
LERHGLRPKHHFGQNFLADDHLNTKLADLIATGAASVIEIGAGLGALTHGLLQHGIPVTAIERDRDLIPVLHAEFQEAVAAGSLTLIEADAKTFAYGECIAALPRPCALAGNLPYQLTGPLLRTTCELAESLLRAVFLLQLEVTDRLVATPGSDHYGALSVFVQAAYDVKKAFAVRRGAFYPQPNVDSAVVVLTPLPARVAEEDRFFSSLVQAAFQQRRKTLKNAWRGLFDLPNEAIKSAAERAQIDLSVRGETLSVHDFARMSAQVRNR